MAPNPIALAAWRRQHSPTVKPFIYTFLIFVRLINGLLNCPLMTQLLCQVLALRAAFLALVRYGGRRARLQSRPGTGRLTIPRHPLIGRVRGSKGFDIG